ncbi:uncharacterized protein LOC126886191 [Diabrotica virgifera virgifera]|uniref:Reverse transcriptase domain-containing protein n=1 Tax=Diabrotica virgifera virgifera TaxID=50390 RepID=A0ABM5KFR9_DIAVI|nr:uncharacterized protein LOC126886191 [Diabrotica virgifera virgifera]
MSFLGGFFHNIRLEYGDNNVISLKQWSKLCHKLAKLEARRLFLLECRRRKQTPTFIQNQIDRLVNTTFRATRGSVRRRVDNFESQVRVRLLNISIHSVHHDIKTITQRIQSITSCLRNSLPAHIINNFDRRLLNQFNFTVNKSLETLQKKIANLGITPFSKIKHQQKWFKNLTDIDLPPNVSKLLALGPKFGLAPTLKDYSICNLLSDVENILTDSDSPDLIQLRSSANNIILNYTNAPKKSQSEIDRVYIETKTFLKDHPELLVLLSDKGNTTVLMYRDQYMELSQSLLNDDQYYRSLPRNPTITFTSKINKHISNLKRSNIITDVVAKALNNYNGIAPRFYCLPKIHKPQLSMRPIVSSINSPNCNIAKFLANILSTSYDHNNEFNISDSFKFSEFINNFQLPIGFQIVSFDVVSLFTNLPLPVVLSSLHNHWNQIQPHCPFGWETFVELLKLVFDTNYFVYNDKFYLQIFGTPMGSSISPLLVGFVLDDLILDRLSLLDYNIPFVKRYVDDLILAVPTDQILNTLSVFNDYNPHLQFTCEMEENNTIPFLDMLVVRGTDNILRTKWFRKSVASNRFLNYYSFHPKRFKHNLVQGLALRTHRLSHPLYRSEASILLKTILGENSYPISLINRYICSTSRALLDQTYSNLGGVHDSPQVNIEIQRDEVSTSVSPHRYCSLPYFPYLTEKLTKLFKPLSTKIGIKNCKTVGNLFSRTKTPIDIWEKSNVVYNIPCKDCHLKYIGHKKRTLKSRVTSHRSDIRCNKHSCALSSHSISLNHQIDFDNIKSLGSESNFYKRTFLEMTHILREKDSMNKRTDIDNLSIIYHSLLLNNP